MRNLFDFTIVKRLRSALGRAGLLTTPHGVIETPAFVVVGTKGSVKAVTPRELKEIGVPVLLANTYHLYLEPGAEVIRAAGGLHRFMGWNGPILTDSGGFQVFSLGTSFGRRGSKVRRVPDHRWTHRFRASEPAADAARGFYHLTVAIDEDGVTFREPRDGSTHRFTPEASIDIQHMLGADIIFAFDECTSPDAPYEYQREAMERTERWAKRCFTRHRALDDASDTQNHPALFGIVQGGRFEDLRKESAQSISRIDVDGFGIGGSFEKRDIDTAVSWVNHILPEEKPRHLLGIGDPLDLFAAVQVGCDLFDCVVPTREARTGSLYTRSGRMNITNARFIKDPAPFDVTCDCYTCKNFSRAYLAHLYRSHEMLAATLGSIHNLRFFTTLVSAMRQAILDGTFTRFRDDFFSRYQKSAVNG